MPSLDVPFMTELRPFEDLKLATTRQPNGASAPPSAMPNTFTAMVSSVHFEEYVESAGNHDSDDDSDENTKKKGPAKSKGPNKDVDVRITLVANMSADDDVSRARGESALRCVTLASHIFRSAKAAPTSRMAPTVMQRETQTLETHLLTLKYPLLFSSQGAIRSLSVLAHVVPSSTPAQEDAAAAGQSKGPKAYRGDRLFMVRLLGVQQTTLTAEQVLLLVRARK